MNMIYYSSGHIPQGRKIVTIPIDDALSDTSSKDGVPAKHNNFEGDRGLERIPETDESAEESVEIGNKLENMSTVEVTAVQALHSLGMECDRDTVCDGAVSGDGRVGPGEEADFRQNYPLDTEKFGKDPGDEKPKLRVESKGDLDSYSECHETGICNTQKFTNAAGIERAESPIRVVKPTPTNFDIYGRGILGFYEQ